MDRERLPYNLFQENLPVFREISLRVFSPPMFGSSICLPTSFEGAAEKIPVVFGKTKAVPWKM